MSTVSFNGSVLGTPLQEVLMADSIQPGSQPSYQICKTIYSFHPLGFKMADAPIKLAQKKKRKITIQKGPEERLREAFDTEWDKIGSDRHIRNTTRLARVYGIASLALMVDKIDTAQPVAYGDLWKKDISFNVLDPLNTAGSLVLNQDPNAVDFQHIMSIAVSGKSYHPSRTRTLMNEAPVYIEYTSSAFGYVGRSVYQRALFPMKSFVRTMVTDDMVARKAGLLIAKMEQPGSIINGLMQKVGAIKRNLLKQGETDNVLEVGKDDVVESINFQNLEGPAAMARKNIIENIASAADMPAKLLLQESFAEGFGEGSEDAKLIADYIDDVREQMMPLYLFFDEIVMWRAWNPEFYKIIQRDFPDEYGDRDYKEVFYEWKNSFAAEWPTFLDEPDSEKVKVDDVKLKAAIAYAEVLLPQLDPENKAILVQWLCDNVSELKLMFGSPLSLDLEALTEYVPPEPATAPDKPQPFADSVSGRRLTEAVARLTPVRDHQQRKIRP